MPLADYFTGYRQTVKQPGELIRAVRIPLPLAPVGAFHKIAKRRFDDISSVAVGFALDRRRVVAGGPHRPRRGGGHRRCGPPPPRPRCSAGHGPATPSGGRARAGREGTPIDDHRASAAYRAAMLGQSLLKFHAESTARGGRVMSDTGRWPTGRQPDGRPRDPARERGAARHRGRALHRRPRRLPGPLHAWPVQAPHAHAMVTRLDTAPAFAVPGVVRVLTADDVPGVNDAGVKHDEPLFPSEVMFYGHAVCWVLAETLDGRPGSAPRPSPSSTSRCRR